MFRQTQSRRSAISEKAAEPIAIPHPAAEPVNRAALLQRLRAKFEARLFEMRNEASQNDVRALLAECLTWQFAGYIVEYGAVAAGDILTKLGTHVTQLYEYQKAQREAEAAKEKGVQTH